MGQSVTGARLTQVSVNLDGSTTNILASSQKSAAIRKAIGLARDDEEYQAPKRFFEEGGKWQYPITHVCALCS